jgi:hypothetical protein
MVHRMYTTKVEDLYVFNKLQHWRQQNGYDLYPVLRLILPQACLLLLSMLNV